MNWNYTELYAKADEFEQKLPQMIQKEQWAEIHKMLSTMLGSISGETADAFSRAIDGSCRDKNVDCIMAFPNTIRNACNQMQSRDEANAQQIRNAFSDF